MNKNDPPHGYLFYVTNWHSPDCGPPPSISGDTRRRRYSYFQNEYGEQAIFEYNMETKTGTLWMGDVGWGQPHTVTGGHVSELVLTPAERLWLAACWYAATEELPKHGALDRFQSVAEPSQSATDKLEFMYQELMRKSGGKCYTLTADKEALMHVNEAGVIITYPTGNTLHIPRQMVEQAIHELLTKGHLTDQDVHERFTNRQGPVTDRLLAILRKLPGVTHTSGPRVLYYSDEFK